MSLKQCCQLINVDGEISSVFINQNLLISSAEFDAGESPFPFYNQSFESRSKVKLLFGDIPLQWCKLPLHRAKYPYLCAIFFKPASWDLPGMSVGKKMGLNAKGIFINKYHEIFGKMLLFNANGQNLTPEDIEILLEDSKIAVADHEELNGFFIMRDVNTKSREDRWNVVNRLIDRYINTMHLITYEVAYIIVLPQLLSNYINGGFRYANAINTHCLTTDKRNTLILAIDDISAKENINTDFQYFCATHKHEFMLPAKYDEFVEKHREFSFPFETEKEKNLRLQNEAKSRKRREEILQRAKSKKKLTNKISQN